MVGMWLLGCSQSLVVTGPEAADKALLLSFSTSVLLCSAASSHRTVYSDEM
jgi:hypothetical protein